MSKKGAYFYSGLDFAVEGVRKSLSFFSPLEPVAHFNSLIY